MTLTELEVAATSGDLGGFAGHQAASADSEEEEGFAVFCGGPRRLVTSESMPLLFREETSSPWPSPSSLGEGGCGEHLAGVPEESGGAPTCDAGGACGSDEISFGRSMSGSGASRSSLSVDTREDSAAQVPDLDYLDVDAHADSSPFPGIVPAAQRPTLPVAVAAGGHNRHLWVHQHE